MRESVETSVALFERLNERGVRYCHWKSNEHLEAGLAGATDLDLLVDERQRDQLYGVLGDFGFKRFPTHPARSYPGMEDIFGVDRISGRLLHLHVQYRLLVGQRHFKDFHLPWEDLVLESRVAARPHGVFIAAPEVEWLLLVVRAAMKLRWRSITRGLLRPASPSLEFLAEHRWLAERTEGTRVVELARDLLGAGVAPLVAACLEDDLAFGSLVRLRRSLRSALGGHRSHTAVPAALRRWMRELRWVAGTANRRYVHAPIPYSRQGSTGGIIIAVVGSDGSGKSTVVSRLAGWLSKKMDILTIYFGSGDGPASLLRAPLVIAKRLVVRVRGTSVRGTGRTQDRDAGRIEWPAAVWALTLAQEKRLKLRRAMRARARGFVVLCDRWPQNQIAGMNDGPLLAGWAESPSRLRRFLSRWEAEPYRQAAVLAPDIVVRLLVSPAVAIGRKPADDPGYLEYRSQVVRKLDFGFARLGFIDIDADRDLEEVLLEIKQRVWPEL